MDNPTKLALFKASTNVSDDGIALQYLTSTDWELQNAIQLYQVAGGGAGGGAGSGAAAAHSFSAVRRLVITTAAAPSVVWLELPAWLAPPLR